MTFSLCSSRGNFLSTITDDYIKKCNFDTVNNTYCPIFRVGDVVRYAEQNFSKLADMVSPPLPPCTDAMRDAKEVLINGVFSQMSQGGVIGIKIGWICDLDKSDDQCNPSYSFTRLDAMSQRTVVSPGYNFR